MALLSGTAAPAEDRMLGDPTNHRALWRAPRSPIGLSNSESATNFEAEDQLSTPFRIRSLERKSASALPTFIFNSADTSGLSDDLPPPGPLIPEPPLSAPSKPFGHRREASAFIGVHVQKDASALTGVDLVTKKDVSSGFESLVSQGSPMPRRGHAHRRSAAVSAHDVPIIPGPSLNVITPSRTLTPQSANTRVSACPVISIPPLAPPPFVLTRSKAPFARSSNFMSRPLSTISSEAESSASSRVPSPTTYRDQSRGASLSPAPVRLSRQSSLWEVEDMTPAEVAEASEPVAMTLNPRPNMDRCVSEPAKVQQLRLTINDVFKVCNNKSTSPHLDRRKSESSLLELANPPQKNQAKVVPTFDRRGATVAASKPTKLLAKPSAIKVKAWAAAVMQRIDKKMPAAVFTLDSDVTVPRPVDSATATTPLSEAELDELFSGLDPFGPTPSTNSVVTTNLTFTTNKSRTLQAPFDEDNDRSSETMIDLDAALGPNRTPGSKSFGARRHLHSGRGNREFNSPGDLYHRRTESAPVLLPFDQSINGSPMHSPMADVFEEDEEDEMIRSTPWTAFLDLSQSKKATKAEHPHQQQDDARIKDPHVAEPALVEIAPMRPRPVAVHDMDIEIVEDHEEPRASVLTKSSDSSDTATVLGESAPDSRQPALSSCMLPPMSLPISALDNNRRRTSFETSRLGTSASSFTDCRTLSSFSSERMPDARLSVDDVPSLASCASTMMSSLPPSRRDFSDRASSVRSQAISIDKTSDLDEPDFLQTERRRKRSSIQSLTKLLPGSFGENKSKLSFMEHANASSPELLNLDKSGKSKQKKKKKMENRLSRLMFWKDKSDSATDD